jgi:adenylosuccinate synthase
MQQVQQNRSGLNVFVVGTQWGDEGKGKVVDLYTEHADVVARFGGGANAGHTLVVDGQKLVTHLLPSGVLHPGKKCVLGAGMVVEPRVLLEEIEGCKQRGLLADDTDLLLSDRAHVILRYHRDIDALVTEALELGQKLSRYVADTSRFVHDAIRRGESVLCEGAQGALLDVDHGTYPFVTSSSTLAGGACTGLGIGPTEIDAVVGISKAYATRVGAGPFPTELLGEEGDKLREAGSEYGATTGRPRRCGWLDLPALRLAVRLNGMNGIALTKLDVLKAMKQVKACVSYKLDGRTLDELPLDAADLARVEPVYETFEGITADLSQARDLDDLPVGARRYLSRISDLAGVPLYLVSVGPGRAETMVRKITFR